MIPCHRRGCEGAGVRVEGVGDDGKEKVTPYCCWEAYLDARKEAKKRRANHRSEDKAMVENEAIQVGDAKEVQPELTDSAGKNVMPHVPKLTQLGREWYGAKIDTKQAGDALDAELIKTLDKLAPKILKAFEESNLASYHVILQDGSDRMLFRKEFSARQQIGEKKCGKQGDGRPRRKKAK